MDIFSLTNPVALVVGMILDRHRARVPDIAPEVVAELTSDYTERILTGIHHALIQALPDRRLAELNRIFDEGLHTDEGIVDLIHGSGIDVRNIVSSVIIEFAALYGICI